VGLGRLFRREDEQRDSSFWTLPGGYGYTSAAYGPSPDAMKNAASWACMNVLADAIGRAPIDVVRGTGPDRRPVTPPNIIASPSGVVQTDVWRFQLGWSMVSDGNAFGRITSMSPTGAIETVELLDPRGVTERKVVKGKAQVRIDYGEVVDLYPWGDIWHVPGRTVPPGSPFAMSPVAQAERVIGTSLAAEQFSFNYFTGDGHPSAIIYADAELSLDEAQAIKSAYRRATSTREPAVFGNGLRRESIQSDPNQTQFLDVVRLMVEQVCRFWGVPPSMVYGAISGEAVTYANVTDSDLSFLKHSLEGYYVRIESALSAIIPRLWTAQVNRNAILRAAPKTLLEADGIALSNRQVTINELRKRDGLVPFGPDFDVPGTPPFPTERISEVAPSPPAPIPTT
jgi:HK97 family phage portal protein